MDDHHVSITQSAASCGILELSRLSSDPAKVLYALASHLYHPSRGSPAAFVMWSDTANSNGANLFDYIETRNSWGTRLSPRIEHFADNLVIAGEEENPKTGNVISVFVWTIPHEEFRKWYMDQRVERAKSL